MKKLTFQKVWNDLINVLDRERKIYTLARRRTNEITDIDIDDIWVMTEKSSPNSKLVPKWMFETAITHLIENDSLSNDTLLNKLNVKRSSFVLAALSQLEYIDYQTGPLKIYVKKDSNL